MNDRSPKKLFGHRVGVLALTLTTALSLIPAGPAHAAQVDLTAFLNNVGIQQSPAQTNADFDGGGYAYSAAALQLGDPVDGYDGVEPGDQISAGGFTFTWPQRPEGATDNVLTFGQTIPVAAASGATKLGLLGTSVQGAGTGTFTLNYSYTDGNGVVQNTSVTKSVTFSDWTRGLLGDEALHANETVVLKSRFRGFSGSSQPVFFFTTPHVFLSTVTLDPSMTLE
ncbi:MAG: hypothetical protein ACRDH9_11410, partial [Actinomycetota bacterium]